MLVAPLGVTLTALGFLIYKHRASLALPGIAATAALSAAFSVATSVAAAKLIGVSTGWWWEGGRWRDITQTRV